MQRLIWHKCLHQKLYLRITLLFLNSQTDLSILLEKCVWIRFPFLGRKEIQELAGIACLTWQGLEETFNATNLASKRSMHWKGSDSSWSRIKLLKRAYECNECKCCRISALHCFDESRELCLTVKNKWRKETWGTRGGSLWGDGPGAWGGGGLGGPGAVCRGGAAPNARRLWPLPHSLQDESSLQTIVNAAFCPPFEYSYETIATNQFYASLPGVEGMEKIKCPESHWHICQD